MYLVLPGIMAFYLFADKGVVADKAYGQLVQMNGLYFIPIFAVVIVGMLARRVPPLAAKVALIVGFAAIALGYFVPVGSNEYGLVYVTNFLHEFHFLGVVFALLVAVMLVIGRVMPLPEAWKQRYSGDVEMTPWKYAVPSGVILVILVFVIYAVFADFSVLSH